MGHSQEGGTEVNTCISGEVSRDDSMRGTVTHRDGASPGGRHQGKVLAGSEGRIGQCVCSSIVVLMDEGDRNALEDRKKLDPQA